ncbi:hypothetical protein GCM10009734_97030 [Nonomuraea bangladeshensis]
MMARYPARNSLYGCTVMASGGTINRPDRRALTNRVTFSRYTGSFAVESEVGPDRVPSTRITSDSHSDGQLSHSEQAPPVLSRLGYRTGPADEVRDAAAAQVIDHDPDNVRATQYFHHEEALRLPRACVPQCVADQLSRHPPSIIGPPGAGQKLLDHLPRGS